MQGLKKISYKKRLFFVTFIIFSITAFLIYRHQQQIPDDAIAFTSNREGGSGIYLIAPDRSFLKRLSLTPCCQTELLRTLMRLLPRSLQHPQIITDSNPLWSPDGQQIAYVSYPDTVYVINKNGSDRNVLLPGNDFLNTPSWFWSTNSSLIFFRQIPPHSGNLIPYTVHVEEGTVAPLTYNFGSFYSRLSLDVTKFAFQARETPLLEENFTAYSICYGTFDRNELTCSTSRAYSSPFWSPDGEMVAFLCGVDNNTGLCVWNIDSNQITEISPSPEILSIFHQRIVWSPNSTKFIFEARTIVEEPNHHMPELFVVNADGSNLLRLTNDPGFDAMPSWSPDSSRVAFASDRNGNWDIYVINADGSNLTRLTYNSADDTQPAWRPHNEDK